MRQEFVSNCWGSSLFWRCSPSNMNAESLSIAAAPPCLHPLSPARASWLRCTSLEMKRQRDSGGISAALKPAVCTQTQNERRKWILWKAPGSISAPSYSELAEVRVCVCVYTTLLDPSKLYGKQAHLSGPRAGPIAIRMTKTGIKEGTWIILQGCHTPTLRR